MLTSTLGRLILATVKNILKVLFIFVFNLFSASSHALILSSFFGNPNKITTQSSFEYIWQLSTRWQVFIVVSNPRDSSNMHVNISLDWPFFSTKFFNSDSNFFSEKGRFSLFLTDGDNADLGSSTKWLRISPISSCISFSLL